ncbi:MAG TPA: efflux RND transporter periplasmic adaptor subunit [Gemmatimonadaceae bacterium]|nr:efflux RND transporter periplasmic adaptor subunit [Gemmatimonadaceae bacterium]
MKRFLFPVAFVAIALAPACSRNATKPPAVSTSPVTRRDIVIDAQANGVVEPINIVEVKSKASGLITRMPVETGTLVKPGDLIVQVDARDVQNQYNQADADLKAAEARLEVSDAQKKRSDEMYKQRVITAQEHETAALDYANATANAVRARANLDLAKQRLEDATVTAPVAGTVIEKTVSQGMVITSATGAFGGGTTLIKMADLGRVRMRALFNETDIGQIRSTQVATVVVDAYPDRRFNGLVEKIEPQAVVQQGVTMFPVLITLSNTDGSLRPGMNGEVSVTIEERKNVLAVPNDAVKNMREAIATAPLLGLNPEVVQAQLRSQRGFGGGTGAAGRGGQGGGQGGANSQRISTSPGEVALDPQQGGGGRQGGFQMPEVSDKDCADVKAAIAKKPTEAKKLEDLRAQMMSGQVDRNAMREESQKLYAAIGIDGRVAMACRRREMQAQGAGPGAPVSGAPASGQASGGTGGRAVAQSGRQGGGGAPQLQLGNTERGGSGQRVRPALVFVAKDKTYEPRSVLLGAGNFDYTEVVSGLEEGEQVAMLASLALQAQRQQQNDRFRQGMGGVPGLNQGGGGAGGNRPGGGGGGPR